MKSNAKFAKRCVLTVACAIGSMSLFALTPAGAAEAYHGVAANPTSEALHAWHENLKAFPPMEEGCFHASYPSLAWEAEQCGAAPAYRSVPPKVDSNGLRGGASTTLEPADEAASAQGGSTQTAGGGVDYMAQTTNLTSSATGSFPAESGVTSASTGDYTLQMNTNASASTVCSSYGYSNTGCVAWEQFIYASKFYSTDGTVQGPHAFIQNWMWPSATEFKKKGCPAGWSSYRAQHGCYKNSSAVAVDSVALSGLSNVKLAGSASISGNDTVTFTNGTTAKAVSQSGSTVKIGAIWKQTEFNVVGDGGGSALSFNAGSSLTVKIQVNDGSQNAPTCLSQGETGETNNLNLKACTAAGGSAPYIQFVESN